MRWPGFRPQKSEATPGTTTTVNVDTVRFQNNDNTSKTDWLLDRGRLTGDGHLLLDASTAQHLDATFGEGNDNELRVLHVESGHPVDLHLRGTSNVLTIGGQNDATLDDIKADVNVSATSGDDALVLDDSLGTVPQDRRFEGDVVRVDGV